MACLYPLEKAVSKKTKFASKGFSNEPKFTVLVKQIFIELPAGNWLFVTHIDEKRMVGKLNLTD